MTQLLKKKILFTSFILVVRVVDFSGAANTDLYVPRKPYVAPPYVPPPPLPSRLNLLDNGDGTITETKSKLMWTQKDSFSDLGRCLNWHDSKRCLLYTSPSPRD